MSASYKMVLIAFAVYVVTAYSSLEFYHADEHYQIIEFAGLKLGINSPEDLAWEYTAQIRPTIQPTICYLIFKALNFIHITNPYTQAFVLRLLTAFLALFTIYFFNKKTDHYFKNPFVKNVYCFLMYFLWFLPYVNVRFSSETWSGLLFLLSIGVYLEPKINLSKPYILGLIFGLSFLFRFQIAFAIIGFVLWLIFVKRKSVKYLFKISISFLVLLILGIIIDSWFYGNIVFTPYNYFYKNVIENIASNYGVSPWYYYLLKIISFPTYIIGIPLLISLCVFVVRKPKSIYTWCILSFIVLHSIIPHKEGRFLFPIINLFPLIITFGFEWYIYKVKGNKFVKIFLLFFVAINIALLGIMSYKSSGRSRLYITKYIYDKYRNQSINLVYCREIHLFDPVGLEMNFYKQDRMKLIKIDNLCEINNSLKDSTATNFLLIEVKNLEETECLDIENNKNYTLEKISLPIIKLSWLKKLYSYGIKSSETDKILLLYRYGSK